MKMLDKPSWYVGLAQVLVVREFKVILHLGGSIAHLGDGLSVER